MDVTFLGRGQVYCAAQYIHADARIQLGNFPRALQFLQLRQINRADARF
jgi:hypothetical protein